MAELICMPALLRKYQAMFHFEMYDIKSLTYIRGQTLSLH
jgi:hypothetical protein